MPRTTIAVTCLALLVACTTAPTAAEIDAAEIGPRPTQANAEEHALRLLEADGLTPEQFEIEFSPLRRSWYQPSTFRDPQFGWELEARVEARSRSQRRAAGVGDNRFYWVHGRCVGRAYDTRYFDGSRSRTFLPLDAVPTPPERADVAGAEPAKPAHEATEPSVDQGRIDELLVRRSTLRSMRSEAEKQPDQRAAIDLLLEAVGRQLTAAGYAGG